jgi:hypothetical protein
MSSWRFRTATVRLCLILVGISLGLATPQAQATPEWMFSAGPVVPELPAEVSAKAEGALHLLTEILKISTNFSCKVVTAEKALLEAKGEGSGKLLFSGCETLLNGTPNANCVPKSLSAGTGTIVTRALKTQLVTHEGSSLIHVVAVEAGDPFTTVEMGASCAIGTKVPVIGAFYAKDSNGKLEVDEVSHALEAGPLTELWSISKTTEHKATAEGSVDLSLAGEGIGALWSGLGI